jgi:putative endonuclease
MTDKKKIGAYGENIAADFLIRKGYEIIDRHFQTRTGEVDLIAKKDSQIIFVEVKTRTSRQFGLPEEAIDWRKRLKLMKTAKWYLAGRGEEMENYRIDSIAVEINRRESKVKIRHYKNITYNF